MIPLAALAQGVLWNLANEYPPTTLPAQADAHFAGRVGELTRDAIRVVPHFEAKLGLKNAEQMAAVASGRVQLASTFGGGLAAREPVFQLPALPFLTATVDDARRLFEIARPHFDRALARHNQRLLYVSPWPPSGLWAREPVTTLDALRRQRVRTFDDTSANVLKQLGATALTISFSEAMPRIQSGEVNAVLSSGDGGAGQRLWQFLQHFTELNYAVPLSFVTINLDAWRALDERQRLAVTHAADETTELQWQRMRGRVEANYDAMQKNGVTIAKLAAGPFAEALREAARGIVADWERTVGPDATLLLGVYRGR